LLFLWWRAVAVMGGVSPGKDGDQDEEQRREQIEEQENKLDPPLFVADLVPIVDRDGRDRADRAGDHRYAYPPGRQAEIREAGPGEPGEDELDDDEDDIRG